MQYLWQCVLGKIGKAPLAKQSIQHLIVLLLHTVTDAAAVPNDGDAVTMIMMLMQAKVFNTSLFCYS